MVLEVVGERQRVARLALVSGRWSNIAPRRPRSGRGARAPRCAISRSVRIATENPRRRARYFPPQNGCKEHPQALARLHNSPARVYRHALNAWVFPLANVCLCAAERSKVFVTYLLDLLTSPARARATCFRDVIS